MLFVERILGPKMTKRKPSKTHMPFKGKSPAEGSRNQSASRSGDRDRKFRGKPDISPDHVSAARPADRKAERPHGGKRENRAGSGASQRLTGRDPENRPQGVGYWLFGHHAVAAAIANPERRIHRLVQVGSAGESLAGVNVPRPGSGASLPAPLPAWENIDREALDHILGRDAVHQGIAARVSPLPEHHIEEVGDLAGGRPTAVVLILDQVTDPHNVGAILRSAAAFGAIAVVLTERHAAPETGVLAKAASGALEHVPVIRVTNLVRAMEDLKQSGFWCVGLAAEAERTLAENKLSGRVALCLGAEGPGLRRLTREHCDLLAKLPTEGPIDHLNVSNAAAVSLYELMRR